MSLFENFSYLFAIEKNKEVPMELGGIFPWVLWMLWKNRNSFVFEGKSYDAEDTVCKIKEDARQWFAVHGQNAEAVNDIGAHWLNVKRWRAPGRRV